MVTAILDKKLGITKERLIGQMNERNIDCRPFLYPLSSLPAYENTTQSALARQRNHVSYKLSPFGVNLPSGLNLNQEKVTYICENLKGILKKAQSSSD